MLVRLLIVGDRGVRTLTWVCRWRLGLKVILLRLRFLVFCRNLVILLPFGCRLRMVLNWSRLEVSDGDLVCGVGDFRVVWVTVLDVVRLKV